MTSFCVMVQPGNVRFITPYSNLGSVDSWGWELSLKWNDKIGDNFRYWAGINLSYNQNEILEKKEAPQNNLYQYQKDTVLVRVVNMFSGASMMRIHLRYMSRHLIVRSPLTRVFFKMEMQYMLT